MAAARGKTPPTLFPLPLLTNTIFSPLSTDAETRGPASFDVDPHVPEDLQHLVKAVIANLLTNDIAVVVQKEEGGEVGQEEAPALGKPVLV